MEAVLIIGVIGFIALFLAIGAFVADYIFPRIPAIERFLDQFESE